MPGPLTSGAFVERLAKNYVISKIHMNFIHIKLLRYEVLRYESGCMKALLRWRRRSRFQNCLSSVLVS